MKSLIVNLNDQQRINRRYNIYYLKNMLKRYISYWKIAIPEMKKEKYAI